jgi:hypothetical protein
MDLSTGDVDKLEVLVQNGFLPSFRPSFLSFFFFCPSFVVLLVSFSFSPSFPSFFSFLSFVLSHPPISSIVDYKHAIITTFPSLSLLLSHPPPPPPVVRSARPACQPALSTSLPPPPLPICPPPPGSFCQHCHPLRIVHFTTAMVSRVLVLFSVVVWCTRLKPIRIRRGVGSE